MKVCHFTSAHNTKDTRIFLKECVTLSKAGYETFLVGREDSRQEKGVHVIGVGAIPNSRKGRVLDFSKKVYKKALELDCDIYHFHDPELLPYGIRLMKKGKAVIFDSHEDVPAQIMDKPWIPNPMRKTIAGLYKVYETHAVGKFDAVIAATKHIADTFNDRANKVVVINNYPKLDDVIFQTKPFKDRSVSIAYAGGLSEVRGERVLVEAMKTVNGVLNIACDHEIVRERNINYLGARDRKGVNELYGDSRMGIVIYQPADNHYDSQPIKMFEFMASGLPVVASNFPLWREIVEINDCGICVDPCDPIAVSKACNTLLGSPELAERMGQNGRKAVEEKYSWMSEEKKLLKLYKEIEKKIASRN